MLSDEQPSCPERHEVPGRNGAAGDEPGQRKGRARQKLEPLVLLLLTLGIYLSRITALPVAGEEARWARGAVQMIETGDWIVLRQQGHVFPERPPMSSWAMAVVGLLRGRVDVLAIRLPSVVATVLTVLVIYVYARSFLPGLAAFASGAIYATMGQVLQLGRMGESEALFSLLVSASLLCWHWGYVRRWSPALVWTIGYTLAALGALVKGPQAPVYFVAVTSAFLLVRADWRWLIGWPHAMGLASFAAVVGAWQIPYYFATDWHSVAATWTGLAADRITLRGLARHVIMYPFETFGCLLPWSPLLLLLVHRRVRQSLEEAKPVVLFLATALLVTYPTVWLASGARGRYFMPLYPCLAILLGLLIQRCTAPGSGCAARQGWARFVGGCAVVIALAGAGVLAASFLGSRWLAPLRQPAWFALVFGAASGGAAAFLLWLCGRTGRRPAYAAVVTLSAFCGLAYTGAVINVQAASWNDLAPTVARIKQQLAEPERLVSLGPVDHRFAYAYQAPIRELPWPASAADLPPGTTYFCFNRTMGDTPERRIAGRGRTCWTTPGTLPFPWQKIGEVCCDRKVTEHPHCVVIIAQMVAPSDSQWRAEADSDRRQRR